MLLTHLFRLASLFKFWLNDLFLKFLRFVKRLFQGEIKECLCAGEKAKGAQVFAAGGVPQEPGDALHRLCQVRVPRPDPPLLPDPSQVSKTHLTKRPNCFPNRLYVTNRDILLLGLLVGNIEEGRTHTNAGSLLSDQ